MTSEFQDVQVTGVRLRDMLQNPVLKNLVEAHPEVEYALFKDVRTAPVGWLVCPLDIHSERLGLHPREVSRSLIGLDALPIRQAILEDFKDGSKLLKLEIGNPEKSAPIYPSAIPRSRW
jgi:hypothetical protein